MMNRVRRIDRASVVGWLCLATGVLGFADPTAAELINIDIDGAPDVDTVHSGADGVLSGVGIVWNGIPTGVDTDDLVEDEGVTTEVDVVFASAGGGSTDSNSPNDLQDSGTTRAFDVTELDDAATYDVAIYSAPFSLVRFTDAEGASSVLCTGSPTYSLPGTLGDDYCLFLDRAPADLGGGVFGFTFTPLDGVVMGVQIRRVSPPLAVPALSTPGLVGLLLVSIAGASWMLFARVRS